MKNKGIYILFGLFIWAISSCINQPGAEVPDVPYQITPYESHITEANEIATAWEANAVLQKISISILNPVSEASREEMIFFYDSPSNTYEGIFVLCTRGHCQIAKVDYPEGYQTRICPLRLENISMSTEEVFGYAIQHGGKSFLEKDLAMFDLILERALPVCNDHNHWLISFNTLTEPGLRYWFNADTGELVDEPE